MIDPDALCRTDVVMVMAYRDMGDRHRRASFERVWRYYARMGIKVRMYGGESDATFTRASAINEAIRREPDAEIIIQADPDSVVSREQLEIAVRWARIRDGLVVAFTRYWYLTEAESARQMDMLRWRWTGGRRMFDFNPDRYEESGLDGVGNVVAFSRNTWRLCRGFDERFPLWGGDDAVFAYSAEAMCDTPTRRVVGDMLHLWHPRLPQSEPGHPGYAEQFAIVAQYRDASSAGPDAVRALVESRPAVD